MRFKKVFAPRSPSLIENTRLFEAEQARTRELQQALEYQTATSKVLELIGRSPGALEPIFQAMLEHATRLCGAKFGIVFEAVDGGFRALATRGAPIVDMNDPLRSHEVAERAPGPHSRGVISELLCGVIIPFGEEVSDVNRSPVDDGTRANRTHAQGVS